MKIVLDLKGFTKEVNVSPDIVYSGYFRYPVPQQILPVAVYCNEEPETSDLEIINFRLDPYDGKWRPV